MYDLKNKAEATAQYWLPHGGGTGQEFPSALIDHAHGYTLKWYQASSNQSWVRIKITDLPIDVRAIGFKSANDCPHRDPDQVKVKIESNKEVMEFQS